MPKLSFKKKFKIFVSLAALISLLVFLNALSGRSAVKNALLKGVSPFSGLALASVDFLSSTFGILSDIKNISLENADLKNENRGLLADLVRYKELAKENEELRAQLGVAGKKDRLLISAEIVSFDPISPSYSLTVNRGAKGGLSEGMPVIMAGNILLGKISKAYDDFATVSLIADKGNKVSVRSERMEANGVLSGSSGSALLMDLIEKKSDLEVGDLILTSGLDGTYPRDLIVGRVAQISDKEEGIFKQAYVTASYPGFKSANVFIIAK